MSIRIALHDRPGSFSDRWGEFCRHHGVDHEMVDCYDTDIIARLSEFDALMWHFDQRNATDLLMARHVLTSAQRMGLVVFPDMATNWHFDDKVAQKYLLEAVEAPIVPTWAFFDRDRAIEWLRTADYPLVSKLRRGAGSFNVRLVHTFEQARAHTQTSFGRGYRAVPSYFADAGTKLRHVNNMKAFWGKLKRMPGLVSRFRRARHLMGRERGYVLFQKFIPNNPYDTRVTVVGDRAWAFTRDVRRGDFRASGSGDVNYDLDRIDPQTIQIAFDVTQRLKAQSVAFDFVQDEQGAFHILEISYGYVASAIHQCPGHWDRSMTFHEGPMWPEEAHIADMIHAVQNQCQHTEDIIHEECRIR